MLRAEGGRGLAVIWQSQAIHSPMQRFQAVYISLHHTQPLPAPYHFSFCLSALHGSPRLCQDAAFPPS